MIRSLYTGISGLRGHQTRMDVVANNIANVNTTGFKAGRANFQDTLSQAVGRTGVNPAMVGLGVNLAGIDFLLTQGGLQTTYRTLDLAIEGNGFFILNSSIDGVATGVPNGSYSFTRDGTFYVDADGYLVNAQGLYVIDANGGSPHAIRLSTTPQNISSVEIDELGNVTINGGTAPAVGTQIGLGAFANPESLTRVGNNLYQITPNLTMPNTLATFDGAPGSPGRGKIRSGYLEMSNVDLAQEFTNMITTQRGYQANARSITTSDELLQELVNLKR
ncbi:MAG: flagellar hook-basal body complex protein [Thermoanaerobacterales bacterium]|nr:flagellar hook-basal body complex protein [Bacillota bacterium]MDI6906133.1 flagellar hook-basal body complex protein [Thermoanaerobacterales bacterium]